MYPIDALRRVGAEADASTRAARRRLEDVALDAQQSGMTQRAIAEALGRSQPEVHRLLSVARARQRRRWMTASEYAYLIGRELEDRDEDFAFRLVVQALATLRDLPDEADRSAFLGERPSTGEPRWDTLLRAAIGWCCREMGVPAPHWARPAPLRTFWWLRPEPALAGRQVQQTPPELAVVGIWCDADSLRAT